MAEWEAVATTFNKDWELAQCFPQDAQGLISRFSKLCLRHHKDIGQVARWLVKHQLIVTDFEQTEGPGVFNGTKIHSNAHCAGSPAGEPSTQSDLVSKNPTTSLSPIEAGSLIFPVDCRSICIGGALTYRPSVPEITLEHPRSIEIKALQNETRRTKEQLELVEESKGMLVEGKERLEEKYWKLKKSNEKMLNLLNKLELKIRLSGEADFNVWEPMFFDDH